MFQKLAYTMWAFKLHVISVINVTKIVVKTKKVILFVDKLVKDKNSVYVCIVNNNRKKTNKMKQMNVELLDGCKVTLKENDIISNELLAAELEKIAKLLNATFKKGNTEKAILLYRFYTALLAARVTVFGSYAVELKVGIANEFLSFIAK